MNYRKKQKLSKVIYSRPFLLVFLLITIFFVYNLFTIAPKVAETSNNKNLVKAQLADLLNQQETLKVDTDRMKSDAGIEANLREKFRVAKEGEGLIVIVDKKDSDADKEAQKKKGGFFSFLKRIF